MNANLFRAATTLIFTAFSLGALAPAASAQTRKPAPRPAAKPVAKPVAKPAPRPAPAPAPKPAAAAAPAPAPAPAPPARARASSGDKPFDVGTNALNLGIGFGNRYSYGYGLYGGTSSVTPAFSASFERGVVALGPGVLGVGGFIGYQSATYEYSSYFGNGTYKNRYTDLVVMVRGAFHYPVTPQFDAYGGVGVGVRHLGYSSDYTGPDASNYGSTGAASGLFVGGRYYFTPNIGVFSELGYDQTFIKVGLSAKF